MTIRSRLLLLLLPTLMAFVVLIALFFYINWSRQILDSFTSRLQSIVIATSQAVNPEEIEWISHHLQDADLDKNPLYSRTQQKFVQLKQKLPILNLYVVKIEPVKEGDAVLLNDTEHPANRVYEGGDQNNAYRQVFLLDANDAKKEGANKPGEFDFSETDERQVYVTKKAFVTPIYETRKTHERFMSAYAPILNQKGETIALLGADVSVQEIDHQLNSAWLMILIGACITILMVIGSVFLIADRISKPVQQLNQAALDIAAGNYEANIQLKGPREIVELANTLNTMSECLVENISRLRESSLIRESMYGEYECALLLQDYMLQKVIEGIKNPFVAVRSLAINLSQNHRGLLFLWKQENKADLTFTLIEAKEQGFGGLFALASSMFRPLDNRREEGFIDCKITQDNRLLTYKTQKLFPPLVWPPRQHEEAQGQDGRVSLQDQDMIFLYNSHVIEQFGSQEKVEAWFHRILRHFAEDGLDAIHTMLANELNFLAKKEPIKRNFYILGMQFKLPKAS